MHVVRHDMYNVEPGGNEKLDLNLNPILLLSTPQPIKILTSENKNCQRLRSSQYSIMIILTSSIGG
ncbi:hypothetical protein ACRQ5D_07785 [Mucilaginibacter sp. P25]|uniref:hypothetical protein n=1 Tax=Mucilaginibacter sp. P25 TaxID=3423945 RepID=UPI003D7AB184